jgi:hypothetical protein
MPGLRRQQHRQGISQHIRENDVDCSPQHKQQIAPTDVSAHPQDLDQERRCVHYAVRRLSLGMHTAPETMCAIFKEFNRLNQGDAVILAIGRSQDTRCPTSNLMS